MMHTADSLAPATPCLPASEKLAYAANALTVLFLLLALPYAAHRLVTRPAAAMRGAGRQQVGG